MSEVTESGAAQASLPEIHRRGLGCAASRRGRQASALKPSTLLRFKFATIDSPKYQPRYVTSRELLPMPSIPERPERIGVQPKILDERHGGAQTLRELEGRLHLF